MFVLNVRAKKHIWIMSGFMKTGLRLENVRIVIAGIRFCTGFLSDKHQESIT